MKKQYELTVVYEPDVQGAHGEEARKNVEQILARSEAKIVVEDDWGDKKLAYQINSFDQGHFVFYGVEIESGEVRSMEEKIKHEKGVLRYLTLVAEKPLQELKNESTDTK